MRVPAVLGGLARSRVGGGACRGSRRQDCGWKPQPRTDCGWKPSHGDCWPRHRGWGILPQSMRVPASRGSAGTESQGEVIRGRDGHPTSPWLGHPATVDGGGCCLGGIGEESCWGRGLPWEPATGLWLEAPATDRLWLEAPATGDCWPRHRGWGILPQSMRVPASRGSAGTESQGEPFADGHGRATGAELALTAESRSVTLAVVLANGGVWSPSMGSDFGRRDICATNRPL